MEQEIKSRLLWKNSGYHLDQNIFIFLYAIHRYNGKKYRDTQFCVMFYMG